SRAMPRSRVTPHCRTLKPSTQNCPTAQSLIPARRAILRVPRRRRRRPPPTPSAIRVHCPTAATFYSTRARQIRARMLAPTLTRQATPGLTQARLTQVTQVRLTLATPGQTLRTEVNGSQDA